MEQKDNDMKAAEFRVLKNGPLQVSGNFILKSSDGKEMETRDVIFLCRCGASGNKPFCDGSHRRVGLKD
jgi:CDGSH-type Zn-finger protein